MINDVNDFKMLVLVRIYMENGEYVDERVWVNGIVIVSFELLDKLVKIVIDFEEVIVNVNREFCFSDIWIKVD